MRLLRNLALLLIVSNIIVFAESDFKENDSGFQSTHMLTNCSASYGSTQQIPVFFEYASFAYGRSFIGIFYFMSTFVTENIYTRVLSFGLSFAARPANIKRTDGNLNLLDMDDITVTTARGFVEDGERMSTSSPCFFIGSPLPSPQRPVWRKRSLSGGSYLTAVEVI